MGLFYLKIEFQSFGKFNIVKLRAHRLHEVVMRTKILLHIGSDDVENMENPNDIRNIYIPLSLDKTKPFLHYPVHSEFLSFNLTKPKGLPSAS